jgi:hypothetical protein
MTPTKWRRPRTGDSLLRVQFRNGRLSIHAYQARQLRWSNTGDEWDIVAVERA